MNEIQAFITMFCLGWLCCGIYYVGCQLIKLNKTMDEIKKAVKRDE